tara:strand:+ start:2427 stop:2681 length:255 start_codon:yes stop_codon:yes gene_type:complete
MICVSSIAAGGLLLLLLLWRISCYGKIDQTAQQSYNSQSDQKVHTMEALSERGCPYQALAHIARASAKIAKARNGIFILKEIAF